MTREEFMLRLDKALQDKQFELLALTALAKHEMSGDFSSSRAIEEIEFAAGNLATAQQYLKQAMEE